MNTLRLIVIILMLVGTALTSSNAQEKKESMGISISPLFFDLEAPRGGTNGKKELRIKNNSKMAVTRYFQALDMVPKEEAGQSQLIDPKENEYGFAL